MYMFAVNVLLVKAKLPVPVTLHRVVRSTEYHIIMT